MSAYVVEDRFINTLVSWAALSLGGDGGMDYYWQGRRRTVRGQESRIASVLYAENVRSVNSRYKECADGAGFVFRRVDRAVQMEPIQVLKACNCYAYQACETDDWEASEAFAIIRDMKERAIRLLPGYSEATWGIAREAA